MGIFSQGRIEEYFEIVISGRRTGRISASMVGVQRIAEEEARRKPGLVIEIWGYKRLGRVRVPCKAPVFWGSEEAEPAESAGTVAALADPREMKTIPSVGG